MQDRSNATSRTRRRPIAAFVAVLLAFALAFMAFEPNALRSAFANEGEAATADAGDTGDSGLQATEPAETEQETEAESGDEDVNDEATGGDEPAVEEGSSDEEAPADDEPAASGDDENETDARAGPDGSDSKSKARAVLVSCTVTFYDNVASANPSILSRQLVTAQAGQTVQVDVSAMVASPPTSAQVFDGWRYGGETVTDSISVDPQQGDVRLYPAFSSGHWLRFVEGADGSGAVEVPSQFVGAADPAPATLPTTTRVGYAFAGWYTGSMSGTEIDYGTQVTDGAGTVLDPPGLRTMLTSADVELFAKWQGVQTTFRLVTWYQNPDDDGYSYQGSQTIGKDDGVRAISGEMTDVTQVPDVPGFTALPVEQKPIEGDGSTVVHLKYNRIWYEVEFHQTRDKESALFDDLTIEAKYGADIHDKWPKASADNSAYTAAWYTEPGTDATVFVTGIGTMPLGGAEYYPKTDAGLECNTIYMTQDIGKDTFSKYVSQPFTTSNSPWTTADDYMPIKGFMVNAFSEADRDAIRENPAGDKAATYDTAYERSAEIGAKFETADKVAEEGDIERHTLYFYYLRCKYDVVFEENGGKEIPDLKGVYYQDTLAGRAPTEYVVGETRYTAHNGEVYEFAGWYEDERATDVKFDFSSARMPAGNVVLYAKWVPAEYLVQVDPAGGEFVDSGQSTYFYVQHGETLDYIDVERHYVADDNGTFVYDYETEATDDDDFGTAAYKTAQAGDDGQRYSWSENAYSLYGWFKVSDLARAEVPFDFNAGIVEDTSIVARWRAVGMFDIAYNPTMNVEGGEVTGDIDTVLDPGYADLSPTYVMNTPENIEATDGFDYEFVGWQVVEHFDEGADVLDDGLYVEGDGFVVDSELATNNTIHLQALYEQLPAEPETPTDPTDPETPVTPATPTAPTTPAATAQERAIFPKTGDEMQMLAVGMAGMTFLSLGVALIARAMRRAHEQEE